MEHEARTLQAQQMQENCKGIFVNAKATRKDQMEEQAAGVAKTKSTEKEGYQKL